MGAGKEPLAGRLRDWLHVEQRDVINRKCNPAWLGKKGTIPWPVGSAYHVPTMVKDSSHCLLSSGATVGFSPQRAHSLQQRCAVKRLRTAPSQVLQMWTQEGCSSRHQGRVSLIRVGGLNPTWQMFIHLFPGKCSPESHMHDDSLHIILTG